MQIIYAASFCGIHQYLSHLKKRRAARDQTYSSLADEESKTEVLSSEGDFGSLWEVEDIPLLGLNLLAGLVADGELAINNDLHLIVGVLVDERGALLEAVEASRDWLGGISRGRNVPKEGVLIGNQRWLYSSQLCSPYLHVFCAVIYLAYLELGLSLSKVGESEWCHFF
jgi:hypothetical protein